MGSRSLAVRLPVPAYGLRLLRTARAASQMLGQGTHFITIRPTRCWKCCRMIDSKAPLMVVTSDFLTAGSVKESRILPPWTTRMSSEVGQDGSKISESSMVGWCFCLAWAWLQETVLRSSLKADSLLA